MLKNNKGTILVVAVTAMMILVIIGYVCLQMYMNQSLMDTYDSVKKRLYYSSQGAIMATLGYITTQIANPNADNAGGGKGWLFLNACSDATSNRGDLVTSADGKTSSVGGQLLKNVNVFRNNVPFDGTMHPQVFTVVAVRRLSSVNQSHNPEFNPMLTSHYLPTEFNSAILNATPPVGNFAYEIIAKSTAEHKTALHSKRLSLTLHWYFYTVGGGTGGNTSHKIRSAGWRID